MVRLLLALFLSLFLVGLTSVEGRMHVLSLQAKHGLERLCEDETQHVSPGELRVDVIRRGRMPYRPWRRAGRIPPRSTPPLASAWRRHDPRGPPHGPRAPPFAA